MAPHQQNVRDGVYTIRRANQWYCYAYHRKRSCAEANAAATSDTVFMREAAAVARGMVPCNQCMTSVWRGPTCPECGNTSCRGVDGGYECRVCEAVFGREAAGLGV